MQDVLQSCYDDCDGTSTASKNIAPHQTQQNEEDCKPPQEISFEKVVITDVHGHASSNELLAATVHHVKNKGGSYIEIGHESNPVNEFNNTMLFPMIYPMLYPVSVVLKTGRDAIQYP